MRACTRPTAITTTMCCRISIRAGAHFHDLMEVELVELHEPNGWVHIPLRNRSNRMVKAFMLQVGGLLQFIWYEQVNGLVALVKLKLYFDAI